MPYVDIQIPPQKILGPTIIPENTKPQEVFGYLQGAEICNPSWDLFKVMFTLYHDKSPSFTKIWENSFCTFSKPLQQVQVNEEDLLTSSYTRKSAKSHPILPWNQNMCPENQCLEDIQPPKTHIEPKIWWCVDVSPFPMVYFQVPAVSFPGGDIFPQWQWSVPFLRVHFFVSLHRTPKVRGLAGKLQAPLGFQQGKNESPKQQYFGVPWILVFKRCIYIYPFTKDHSWYCK